MPEHKGGVGRDMDRTRAVLEAQGRIRLLQNGTALYSGDDLKAFFEALQREIMPLWERGEIDAAWVECYIHTPIKSE